jgi:hypothetical protein
MQLLVITLYLCFCILTAFALRKKKGGFWLFFFCSIFFTPLVVALLGLLLSDK